MSSHSFTFDFIFVMQSIEKTKVELQSRTDELESLQKSIQEDREKRISIDTELEQVNQTLRDMRDDRRNTDNEARIEETISSLKRYFPGVKGRLVKLCQPTMKRYDLAVTVAGGKDMVSIIIMFRQPKPMLFGLKLMHRIISGCRGC
jgi:hypothetical protein